MALRIVEQDPLTLRAIAEEAERRREEERLRAEEAAAMLSGQQEPYDRARFAEIAGRSSTPGTTFADVYPGDYGPAPAGLPIAPDLTSEHLLANSPARVRERERVEMLRPKRYEELRPYNPGWWERTFFPQSDKLLYAQKAREFNTPIENRDRQNMQVEANLFRAITATEPGRRQPLVKMLDRFYKQQGVEMAPEIIQFLNKAEQEDLGLARQAASMLGQELGLPQKDLATYLNSNPAGVADLFGKMAEIRQRTAAAKKDQAEASIFDQVMRATGEAQQVPETPVEPIQLPMPTGTSTRPEVRSSTRPGGSKRQSEVYGLVDEEAERVKAPPEITRLVKAALDLETAGYDSSAESREGAQGIAQFMPDTARRYGVKDVSDDRQAVAGMFRYIQDLYNQFGGRPELVLAGYNAGEGAVKKYKGVPPYAETRGYVARGMQRYAASAETPTGPLGQGVAQEKRGELGKLNQAIATVERQLSQMSPLAAAHPRLKGILEELHRRREALRSDVRDVERRYTGVPLTDVQRRIANQVAPGVPESMLSDEQRAEIANRAQREEIDIPVERERALEEVRGPGRIKAAEAGNLARFLSPEQSQKLYNTSEDGPVHPPPGMTQVQLAEENEKHRKKTGKDKWAVLKDIPVEDGRSIRAAKLAVESADRILQRYLEDPQITGLIGNILSNPEGAVQRWVDSKWGGVVPPAYYEVMAELEDLQGRVRLARSGQAVTAQEFERLVPLMASLGDVTPEQARAKMKTLRNNIAREYNEARRSYEKRGFFTGDWESMTLEKLPSEEQKESKAAEKPEAPAGPKLHPLVEEMRKRRERR